MRGDELCTRFIPMQQKNMVDNDRNGINRPDSASNPAGDRYSTQRTPARTFKGKSTWKNDKMSFLKNIICRDGNLKQRLDQQRSRLYRLAYSWSHNPALADDLVQEAMVKALKNIRQLRNPEALNPWLNGILANCWRDYFRRRREFEDIDQQILQDHDTPEHRYEQQDICRSIRAAITTLPMGQRQVLTLVELEDASYAEVAEILQIPIGTVMSRLCRARKTLTEILLEAEQTATAPNIRAIREAR